MVEGGADPAQAVVAIAETLRARGRIGLMRSVAAAFARVSAGQTTPVVRVARAADAEAAKKNAGVADADVRIDESLIGGWRLETHERLVDASYKRYLLDIFNRAIA
jgi:hypothetical protein